jgi:uncharacterized glyoxalase superfamily protein PhnB
MTSFREAFPIFNVDNVEAAVAFYTETFGFEATFTHEEGGTAVFAFLSLEPLGIGVARRPEGEERDVALWLYADDVDAAAQRLRAAGATELAAPADQAWGERLASFVDPNGVLVHVGARAG